MRIMMVARLPHEEFNDRIREGSVGKKLQQIIEAAKPESVYFTEFDGLRTCVMVVDVKDSSQIPALAEPWYLTFNADTEFHVAMSPEDLERAGIDDLAKVWA